MIGKIVIVASAVLVLLGCETTTTIKSSLSSVDPGDNALVYLVADNQFHQPLADYPIYNNIADFISEVAVRPPQSAVFGQAFYQWVLEQMNQSRPIIHLGDAGDISCRSEFERFFSVMKSSKAPWLFVPGNHDGYYTGNSQHRSWWKETWDDACGGERFDKKHLLEMYLEERFEYIGITEKNNKCVENGHSGIERGDNYEIMYCAYISSDHYSANRSFIVQLLRLQTEAGEISFVMADTANYKNPPKYRNPLNPFQSKVAGITGEITEKQRAVISTYIKLAYSESDYVYVIGHHPLKRSSFSADGLAWYGGTDYLLDNISVNDKALGYISAHTHKGGYREHASSVTEYNVGSLIDWPLAYASISLANGRPQFGEHLILDKKQLDCSKYNQTKPSFDDLHHFTAYKKITRPPPRSPKSLERQPRSHENVNLFTYSLMAEAHILFEAIQYADLINGRESSIADPNQILEKSKEAFRNGTYDRNGSFTTELEHLLRELRNQYESRFHGKDIPLNLQEYATCNMLWSAKEEAAAVWGKDDPSNRRRQW